MKTILSKLCRAIKKLFLWFVIRSLQIHINDQQLAINYLKDSSVKADVESALSHNWKKLENLEEKYFAL